MDGLSFKNSIEKNKPSQPKKTESFTYLRLQLSTFFHDWITSAENAIS